MPPPATAAPPSPADSIKVISPGEATIGDPTPGAFVEFEVSVLDVTVAVSVPVLGAVVSVVEVPHLWCLVLSVVVAHLWRSVVSVVEVVVVMVFPKEQVVGSVVVVGSAVVKDIIQTPPRG